MRTPKIMLDALDPNEHLVKVPFVTGSRTAAAQAVGKACAEFLAPAPNGLIGDDHAAFGQKQFNVPEPEAEHVVQPDGKAMTVVWARRGLHAGSLPGLNLAGQTRLP
jgi:hypothetical protein